MADSTWKATWKLLRIAFFPIALLQIPAASTELVQLWIENLSGGNQWVTAGILLPYVLIVTVVSAGATFLYVMDPKPIRTVLRAVFSQLRRLLVAGVLVGIICGLCILAFLGPALYTSLQLITQWTSTGSLSIGAALGLLVLIMLCAIPGAYYSTIYYFVPMEVLTDREAPIMACFTRSKRLAKEKLLRTALVVVTIMGLSFVSYGLWSAIGELAARLSTAPMGKTLLRTLSVTGGEFIFRAIVDVWLSYYYILRKRFSA